MDQSNELTRENIIESAEVQFHTEANPMLIPLLETISTPESPQKPDPFAYDFTLFQGEPDMKFGVFKLKIADTPMLAEHQVLDTSNDISGSMDDSCKDGKTKMQHAIHTLKNIVTAIVRSEGASVTMATYGFDNKIDEIFPDTQITQQNESELRAKMDQLHPRNGTDLYQSLESQADRATKRRAENPIVRQTNITMTDGQANEGKSTKYSDMVKKVAQNCTNVFIGFGGDHNAIGLQQLADAQPNGSYFYVAEIEKAGLVFGEVIHQMLYTALTNITIEVENGEIYDYKTNTWSNTLKIPSIVSEAKKTYHLRSKDPLKTCVNVNAQSLIHEDQDASLLDLDDKILYNHPEESIDLTTHMFRQRTQELMFKAHQHNLVGQNTFEKKWTSKEYDAHNETGKTVRKDLVNFCKFMQQYAKENDLEEDELLNTLIADLTVVAKTFGGPRGILYTATKCNSQGRQTSNNTNYIDPNDLYSQRQNGAPRMMRRQNAMGAFDPEFDINAGDNDDFDLGNLPTTPHLNRGLTRNYTTPRQLTMMRTLTGDQSSADLDELEDHATTLSPTQALAPFPPIPEHEATV